MYYGIQDGIQENGKTDACLVLSKSQVRFEGVDFNHFLRTVWKTYKHHVMDPDGDLRPRFIPIIDDPIGVPAMIINHCPFTASDYRPALDAIITEFILINPKPDLDQENRLEERVTTFAKELERISPRKLVVQGESIDNPGTWLISVGWNHTKASAIYLDRFGQYTDSAFPFW